LEELLNRHFELCHPYCQISFRSYIWLIDIDIINISVTVQYERTRTCTLNYFKRIVVSQSLQSQVGVNVKRTELKKVSWQHR